MPLPTARYIPVLKTKRAEKAALGLLETTIAADLTPLMEIVVRKPEVTVAAHIKTAFRDFAAAIHRYPGYLLDTHEIDASGRIGARSVFSAAAGLSTPFVPVVGINRPSDVIDEAISAAKLGVAIRLTRSDLEQARIPTLLTRFLSQRKLAPESTDLLVDLGALDEMLLGAINRFSSQFFSALPFLPRWRSVTLLACAFPNSMGVVQRNGQLVVERNDWRNWRDNFYVRRGALTRLPTYGDCAIQHPSGVEGFDPRFMSAASSVRYTSGDHWFLLKGVAGTTTRHVVQFPRLARALVESDHFCGPSHCAGCHGAQAAMNGAAGLGSPEAWRRLGTIHHLTLAVEQVRALPLP